MKNKNVIFFVRLTGFVLLCAMAGMRCPAFAQEHPDVRDRPLRIVTSFYPMYIMALNVTKNVPGVSVMNLTPPATGCLHDYSLTTDDMKKISRADIFVSNGAGMESFADRVADQFPGLRIIRLADGMSLIQNGKQPNPHVWVSVSGAMEEVEKLAAALSEADPERAQAYQDNAAGYLKELGMLREKMRTELKPFAGAAIVTLHEAFPYFAREFGFHIAAVVERDPGTVPSAKEISETVVRVRDANAKAIFIEPQYPSAVAETIARETGVKVYTLDPAVMGPADPAAYLRIMEKNLETLKQALA